MSIKFDPYEQWLGIAEPRRPPHHYQLLGIDLFESDATRIQRAYRQRVVLARRYKVGRYEEQSQQLIDELSRAYACLADSSSRSDYEAALREELGLKQTAAVPTKRPEVAGRAVEAKGRTGGRAPSAPATKDASESTPSHLPRAKTLPAKPLRAKPLQAPAPSRETLSSGTPVAAAAREATGPEPFAAPARPNPTPVVPASSFAGKQTGRLAGCFIGAALVLLVIWSLRSTSQQQTGAVRTAGPGAERNGDSLDDLPPNPGDNFDGTIEEPGRDPASAAQPEADGGSEVAARYRYPAADVPLGTLVEWQGVLEKVRLPRPDEQASARMVISGRSASDEEFPFLVYCRVPAVFLQLSSFVAASERLGRGDEVTVVGRVIPVPVEEEEGTTAKPCLEFVSMTLQSALTTFASVGSTPSLPSLNDEQASTIARLRTVSETLEFRGNILDRGEENGVPWAIVEHQQRQFRVVFPADLRKPLATLRIDDRIHLEAAAQGEYYRWEGAAEIVQLQASKLFLGPQLAGPPAAGNSPSTEDPAVSQVPAAETERFRRELRTVCPDAPPGREFRWWGLFDSVTVRPDRTAVVEVHAATADRQPAVSLHVAYGENDPGYVWLRSVPPGAAVQFSCRVRGLPLRSSSPRPLSLISMRLLDPSASETRFQESLVAVTQTDQVLRSSPGIQSLAWARKGNILVAADSSKNVSIFNLRARRKLIKHFAMPEPALQVQWEPQDPPGYFIAATQAGAASLFVLAESQVRRPGTPTSPGAWSGRTACFRSTARPGHNAATLRRNSSRHGSDPPSAGTTGLRPP